MVEVVVLEAELRQRAGRGGARAARGSGLVPGVVYGDRQPPMIICVNRRALQREIEKGGFTNKLLDLRVDGKTHRVLPREVQLHPVSDALTHVDFLRLAADSEVKIMVPVEFADEEASPGLKRGGVLNVVRHEIEFYCRPDALPEQILISLDGLDIGSGVHINDITLPEGARPTITDRNFTIATIAAPTVHVEEVVAEEEEEEALEEVEGVPGEAPEEAEAEEAEETKPARK